MHSRMWWVDRRQPRCGVLLSLETRIFSVAIRQFCVSRFTERHSWYNGPFRTTKRSVSFLYFALTCEEIPTISETQPKIRVSIYIKYSTSQAFRLTTVRVYIRMKHPGRVSDLEHS